MRRKTTIDIDDALLEQVQQVLGTKGIKDTIDLALRQALVQDARLKTIERLQSLRVDPEELRRQTWGE